MDSKNVTRNIKFIGFYLKWMEGILGLIISMYLLALAFNPAINLSLYSDFLQKFHGSANMLKLFYISSVLFAAVAVRLGSEFIRNMERARTGAIWFLSIVFLVRFIIIVFSHAPNIVPAFILGSFFIGSIVYFLSRPEVKKQFK